MNPYHYELTGESSGWNTIQIITIRYGQTPTSPSAATSTQTQNSTPYQESLIAVAIATGVIGAGLGLLIYLIKRK
jgi:hypothetical protein